MLLYLGDVYYHSFIVSSRLSNSYLIPWSLIRTSTHSTALQITRMQDEPRQLASMPSPFIQLAAGKSPASAEVRALTRRSQALSSTI